MIGLFFTPTQKIYIMTSPAKPMKFKVGISSRPKLRAGQVSKARAANARTKAIFSVGVFGAYFFEQLLHGVLKPIHAPEKGDGGTEWFSVFGFGVFLSCLSFGLGWNLWGFEMAIGAAVGVLFFSKIACIFVVAIFIVLVRVFQELLLPIAGLLWFHFY